MEELALKIRDVLNEREEVVYAILFGSAAEERMRPDSDVDIAVKLRRSMDPLKLGELAAKLEASIGRAVQIVVLNEAPLTLRYEVFKSGLIVFVRDENELTEDKVRAIMEFLDFKPLFERMAGGMMEAVGHA